jgi:ribosomal protein S27AE
MQAIQEIQTTADQIIQSVRCPNCGSSAERHYLLARQLTRTQCPSCDYLMITSSLTGKVFEAYAPGIFPKY